MEEILTQSPIIEPTIPPQPPLSSTTAMPISPPKKSPWTLILSILCIVALALAGYFYWQITSLKSQLAAVPTPTPVSSADVTTKLVEKEDNILSISGSLQTYLKNNCVAGNPPSLEIAKLPVKIDTGIIHIVKRIDNIDVYCSSTDSEKLIELYAGATFENNHVFDIYDNESKELGHGGAPFLGKFGQTIYESENITITAYMEYGSGPALLGDIGITLRGRKEFVTQSGELVFVNITGIGLNGDETRLVDFLTPYAQETDFDKPEIIASSFDEKLVINKFFLPTPKAGTPEFTAMEQLKKELNAISAK